jgi:hypothetical protein
MGESLEFRELLTKKKTIGEWGLEEELTPVIDKLVKPDSLLKLMDGVLKYIKEEVPIYQYHVLRRINTYISRIVIREILEALDKYHSFEKAGEHALEYIILSFLDDTLNMYRELMETKEEEESEEIKEEINKHARTLVAYARAYPDETTRGLIKFINYVADAVEEVKEEINKYGYPLI